MIYYLFLPYSHDLDSSFPHHFLSNILFLKTKTKQNPTLEFPVGKQCLKQACLLLVDVFSVCAYFNIRITN